MAQGSFTLTAKIGATVAPQLGDSLDLVRLLLGPATGFKFTHVDSGAGMRIGYDVALHEEGYRLQIGTGGVDISASTVAGVHYALQTVRQLLPAEIYSRGLVERDWVLPALLIEDQPRFGWRGLHMDVGRHFMPVEFIKKYIDLLAMNVCISVGHAHPEVVHMGHIYEVLIPQLGVTPVQLRDDVMAIDPPMGGRDPHSKFYRKIEALG